MFENITVNCFLYIFLKSIIESGKSVVETVSEILLLVDEIHKDISNDQYKFLV